MRLLAAYDGSPAAIAAIASAGALFAPAEAVVTYVREPELHAVEGAMGRVRLSDEVVATGLAEIERQASEHAAAVVAEGERRARVAGLEPRGHVLAGARPWRELMRLADEQQADLIVTGTHGHAPIGRAFLGSTATSLLHHAATPILVIPAGASPPAGPVLLAYDGSEPAERALRFACAHLRSQPLLVAHVWRSPVRHSIDVSLLRCLPSDTVREFVGDFDAAYESYARDIADRGADVARSMGLTAEGRLVESSRTPWHGLLELASAEHARLIVAGAERSGLVSALGSVSSGLVHHAQSAILIVPSYAPVEADAPAISAESGLPLS